MNRSNSRFAAVGLGAVLTLLLPSTSPGADEASPQWAYSGATGPEHWGQIVPEFSLCATGKSQSPIDIASPVDEELPALAFEYGAVGGEILNNGHTVQVNFKKGSKLAVDGQVFELKQLHFHVPSENHIRGKSFPLEVHLVHADGAGHLAVVGVMFEDGAPNQALANLWQQMPASAGPAKPLAAAVSAAAFLPTGHGYFRFDGSLTTPPCSEGVRWLLLKKPLTASKAQVDALLHALGHPNNRPVQPLNARAVAE
ncbi:MAG: carbonic anhydrase family protein [Acidobacteriota bacterium]